MVYRNKKTGAEVISKSIISAPNYELVKDDAPRETPVESPKKELKEEPKKTSAPKKRGTKK
jgi:hypothetical protein